MFFSVLFYLIFDVVGWLDVFAVYFLETIEVYYFSVRMHDGHCDCRTPSMIGLEYWSLRYAGGAGHSLCSHVDSGATARLTELSNYCQHRRASEPARLDSLAKGKCEMRFSHRCDRSNFWANSSQSWIAWFLDFRSEEANTINYAGDMWIYHQLATG